MNCPPYIPNLVLLVILRIDDFVILFESIISLIFSQEHPHNCIIKS